MKKYTQEFKVGLFVILCLIGLAYLVLSTGKVTFGQEGYHIYVVFDEVAGLDKKAPVMLNGFEVGKVEDIVLGYDQDRTFLTLKLWLKKDVRVSDDAEVSLKTLGLMGEKYIQISSAGNGSCVAAGETLEGRPYADIDTLVTSLNSLMDDNKDRISAIAENMEATSKNFEEFSEDLKKHPWKLLFKPKNYRE